jgi:DNA invertase Pin-like site-specific DNA recombinase
VHFVVVFNLTRFARDKYDHFALRSHLLSLGISLRSATEPIDDTSTGKLMEGASQRSRNSTTTCAPIEHARA